MNPAEMSRNVGDWVGEAGFESVETAAPTVANGSGHDADRATQDDAKHRGVSAASQHASGDVVATLSINVLRAKLDAAIVAEAWDAVKVIAERIRELERVGVLCLDDARRRRQ
jgi:hypothetical protein